MDTSGGYPGHRNQSGSPPSSLPPPHPLSPAVAASTAVATGIYAEADTGKSNSYGEGVSYELDAGLPRYESASTHPPPPTTSPDSTLIPPETAAGRLGGSREMGANVPIPSSVAPVRQNKPPHTKYPPSKLLSRESDLENAGRKRSPSEQLVAIELQPIGEAHGGDGGGDLQYQADATSQGGDSAKDSPNSASSDTPKPSQRVSGTTRNGVSIIWQSPEEEEEWYQQEIERVRTQVEQLSRADNSREAEANSIRSGWKRELFLLFEDPSSSSSAFVVNIFVTLMIVFSAVLSTVETIPSIREGHPRIWFGLETGVIVVFTIEFVLRFCGHSGSWRQIWNHCLSFFTIIDFVAIFPFYITLILSKDTSYEFRLTILRILRLLRVFSAFKYSSLLQLSIEVMIISFKRSADALMALLLFSVLIIVLFSTLIYFAERGVWSEVHGAFLDSDGEYSKFTSIPAAAWYMAVTLTTTGFGDMTPKTFVGKLVSFPAMMCGILLIALPSIIVGRNFTHVWEAARRYRQPRPNVRIQRVGDSFLEQRVNTPLNLNDSAGSGDRFTPAGMHRLSMDSAGGGAAIGARTRHGMTLSRYGLTSHHATHSAHSRISFPPSGRRLYGIEEKGKGIDREIDDDVFSSFSVNYKARPGSEDAGRDLIEELARRDSFEMQDLSASTQHTRHPAGYSRVSDDDNDNNNNDNPARRATYRRDTDAVVSDRARNSVDLADLRRRRISKPRSMGVATDGDSLLPQLGTVITQKDWEMMQAEMRKLHESNEENKRLLKQALKILSSRYPPDSNS